jgi:uncharacterized protein (TIGR02145 family)/uncharacterized repeat protein (TIGR02543 family)
MNNSILIDTVIAIFFLRGDQRAISHFKAQSRFICFSAIAVAEIYDSSKNQREEIQLERLFSTTVGTLPAAPQKSGYRFNGWFTDENGTGSSYVGSTVVTQSMTAFAYWIPVYAVTYSANGGTGNVPIDDNTYVNGQTVTVLGQASLTRTNYAFAGWNTQEDTLGASYLAGNTFAMGSANVILHAKWRMNARNLPPSGWHLPTDAEWTIMADCLIAIGYNWDGSTSGNKISKSLAATTDWATHSIAGTIGNDIASNNGTGFSALPGGSRFLDGSFDFHSSDVDWWSATELVATHAWGRCLHYNSSVLGSYSYDKGSGFSVRLIRD